MTVKIVFIINVLILGVNGFWQIPLDNHNPALDPKFYEDVLDPEECQQQLHYLKDNMFMAFQFVDAGAKLPRGILGGNLMDPGNFHQCLSIDYETDKIAIKGKYCSILIDVDGFIGLPFRGHSDGNVSKGNKQKKSEGIQPNLTPKFSDIKQQSEIKEERFLRLKEGASFRELYNGESMRDENFNSGFNLAMRLGICIPKPCSIHQAFNSSLFDVSSETVFKEDFCRLSDDKPWSPADTTAAVIFSIIGVLTIICTGYDVICKFILKRDAKDINNCLQIFSAYTNGCRLVNFNSGPGTLRCLDGIRVLATLWVVLGHSVYMQMNYLFNPVDMIMLTQSISSIYISAAPLTVDTFFTMSGILLVYTTCGKMNGKQLMKNLHVFYLNRLLRLFPLLATVILLQASFFHRLSDGPMWKYVSNQTDNCRTQWWITLLHLQNFINSSTMCLGQTWYIAIDVQLYIISPVVLFWVLGDSRRTAWMALAAGLMFSLAGATVYNFENNFVAHIIPPPERFNEMSYYWTYYYRNTLTRASPFFVGMVFGYLLHVYRGKKIHLAWPSVSLLWSSAATILLTVFFSAYFVMQEGWDHQFIDNMLNSFMRPAWGMAIGWIVFACDHGYGGPVNWFLSLDMWRLPARLCYGVYLFHASIMFVVGGSFVSPIYFSPPCFTFMFIAFTSISFFLSYFMTLLIDVPFSIISKSMLEKLTEKKTDPQDLPTRIEQEVIEKKINSEMDF